MQYHESLYKYTYSKDSLSGHARGPVTGLQYTQPPSYLEDNGVIVESKFVSDS